MATEKNIQICGKQVTMRYCAATETGYEKISGKSSAIFVPEIEKDEDGNIIDENTLDVLSGLHIGAVQLENGGWTITVVNADSIQDRWFQVDFEKTLGGVTLYRHTENVNTCVRNTGAVIADVDKVYVGVEKAFKDFLPAGTVAIYTTEKG